MILTGRVVERVGNHGTHDGNVVDDVGEIRQQLRQLRAAFAVLRKFELRTSSFEFGLMKAVR